MEITVALFQQYLRGECDESAARAVEQWLHSQDPAIIDKVMLRLWNEDYPAMPDEESRILWQQLERRTGMPALRQKQKVIRMDWLRQRRGIAAAVILALCLAGGIGIFHHG